MKFSGHCLQLCVNAGLSINTIDRLTGAASQLVSHFKHSVVASEELKKRQKQMERPELKLIQSCTTRWNSTYYMLKRLVETRWPVSAVLSCEQVTKRKDRYLDLKSDQWTLAEELVKILEPFETATTFFSYEENSSLSTTLPVLLGLVEGLRKEPESETEDPSPLAIEEFKRVVADEIARRWDLEQLETSDPMVLAPLVDPRFKLIPSLSEDSKECIRASIIEQMDSFSLATAVTPSGSEDEVENEVQVVEPVQKKAKKLTALDKLLGPEKEEVCVTSQAELEQYLLEKTVKRTTEPLTWWKNNEKRFPKLAKVARALLNIPATSTPSERIFSVAGLTVTKLRSSLKPENVDSLIFLNKNLKLLDS